MPRPSLLALLAALSALPALGALGGVAIGCSTQVPLGQQGSPCDFDQQCDPAKGLSCECVRRRSPDDEGPDEILAHGFCDFKGVKCPKDGGSDTSVTDTGLIDTGASDTGTTDTGASEAGDAASDAADAAASG
jgi:hypothetical protein